MSAPDEPREDPVPVAASALSSGDVARLNEALKALPAEIAASLRAKPLGVKEVRSRWLKWLALAGVVVAIGSGIFSLVSALTTPSVVHQVAPISRTAERLDRGLTGLQAAIDRAQARYRAVRERVAPETHRGPGGRLRPARVLHRGRRVPRHPRPRPRCPGRRSPARLAGADRPRPLVQKPLGLGHVGGETGPASLRGLRIGPVEHDLDRAVALAAHRAGPARAGSRSAPRRGGSGRCASMSPAVAGP